MSRKSKAADQEVTWTLTQIGSPIGRNKIQELNLIGLGLNKIGRSVSVKVNPSIEGMVKKVKHLVKVENSN